MIREVPTRAWAFHECLGNERIHTTWHRFQQILGPRLIFHEMPRIFQAFAAMLLFFYEDLSFCRHYTECLGISWNAGFQPMPTTYVRKKKIREWIFVDGKQKSNRKHVGVRVNKNPVWIMRTIVIERLPNALRYTYMHEKIHIRKCLRKFIPFMHNRPVPNPLGDSLPNG